jgi:hypothetical protein
MQRDRNAARQRPGGAGVYNCGDYFPRTPKQQKYAAHRNEVVELKGAGMFAASFGLRNYIDAFWETGISDVAVNVQFGSMAKGAIGIKRTGSYAKQQEVIDATKAAMVMTTQVAVIAASPTVSSVFWDFDYPLPTKTEDVGPGPDNLSADPHILVFHRSEIDERETGGTLVLLIEVNAGIVTGKMGWVNGAVNDNGCPVKAGQKVYTGAQDLVPLVFGIEHKDKKLADGNTYRNALGNGALRFDLMGNIEADNLQKIFGYFVMNSESAYWAGKIITNVAGAAPYELTLERTPQGYLSGASDAMDLDQTWTGKGFGLLGKLSVVYANGRLSIYGQASYGKKGDRITGNVNIALTDYHTAERLFKEHTPKGITELPLTETFLDTNLPNPRFPLALTAYGNMEFVVTKKAYSVLGQASFVVGPEGHIITAGTLKLQKDVVLVKGFGNLHSLFNNTIPIANVQFGPVNVDLSAMCSMVVHYKLSDVIFKELTASGYYSNHPSYQSEFTLKAVFDMDLEFGAIISANVTATLRAGFKRLGYTLVNATVYVNMGLLLKAFARATPSITILPQKDLPPEYWIKGNLNILALMEFVLKVGFKMGLLRETKDEEGNVKKREWDKELLKKRWVLGTYELNFDFSQALGSGKAPTFSYKGLSLDESDFLEKLWSQGRTKGRDLLKEGSFKEDGKQKGEVKGEAFEPLHTDAEPVGPFAVTDTFAMHGTPHTLYLEVTGTTGQPSADILMASSQKRKLLPQLLEELQLVRQELTTASSLAWRDEFTDKQRTKLQQAIAKLETIKVETERQIAEAVRMALNGTMSDAGVEAIGDALTDYGALTGHNDLGKKAKKTSPLPPPSDKNSTLPPGVDVVLRLPAEKSIYLETYRQYVRRRQLWHSLQRSARDTRQRDKWDENQRQSMLRSTKCLGTALGLLLTSGDDRARNILRPYWTKNRLLGTNSAGEQMRMNVDHVVEWQVRPITGGDWIDEPANFELLEPGANSTAGTNLDNNIEAERQRLARLTQDISWTTDDIQFTRVEVNGRAAPDRYSYHQVETGDHLKDFKKLAKAKEEKEAYNDCLAKGGEPF